MKEPQLLIYEKAFTIIIWIHTRYKESESTNVWKKITRQTTKKNRNTKKRYSMTNEKLYAHTHTLIYMSIYTQ